MIIQSTDRCYEVVHQLSSTSRMAEFLCREQSSKETYLLVRITAPTLAKKYTLFLEEKIGRTNFPDYKECFQSDGAFFAAFTYSQEKTLADKLKRENCTGKERAEIARRLLEQMLLRCPHPYFMRSALQPDMITVTAGLNVDWNYHLDEVGTFEYCTMEAVCLRLAEVIKILFESELEKKNYPLLEDYLLALDEGSISDYLELYRRFMPVYETLYEEENGQLSRTFLQRLWDGFKKIVNRPTSLKGYLRFGKRYVAKKLALCMIPVGILVPLFIIWIAYPWVQARFFTKVMETMVLGSQDMEGYTGKARLVGDLEADNVIYVGTLTEGKMDGQGMLYDAEGNLRYEGEFLADQYSGVGESYYPNGNVEYTGEFAGGQYDGTGKLYDEAGYLIYEGEFFGGLYDGNGTLYYSDGQMQYRGSFSRGLYDGVGALFYQNGITAYEGEFFQGKKSGSGKEYEESGALLYDGNFSRNWYEGEGILYRDGQAVCRGSFHMGILTSGEAILYDGEGKLLYQGGLHNGIYNGEGKLFSGDILIYEGGFAEGCYHGSGREYQEGTGMLLYDGIFEKGEYSGEGRLYDEETGGLLYEGSFYQSTYDGKGKLYDPTEGYLIYDGGFREGLYDGQGRNYEAGMLIYDGEFLLGTYNGRGKLYDPVTGAVVFEGVFYDDQPMVQPVGPEQEE
ncbi:MAG: hypothetical protein J1E65_08130 [Lachnospiraceae bacterium]|nr:hypothetical protein [Lachnospiraceae bacterium]